ncbi:LOW QUALITY PROTEIN: armadillo-like helical domain containing protein 1 [Chlamydotis macqueenii]
MDWGGSPALLRAEFEANKQELCADASADKRLRRDHDLSQRGKQVFWQEWDSAHKVAQSHTLDNFVKSNDGKTEPELELEFSQGATLFLAHLTAWLRMIYVYSTCLNKLLNSIGIFSAASGRRYLIEFLEIGGVLILLEILGLNHLKEEDKREPVKLLQLIAGAGRKYKEFICESYGPTALCLKESMPAYILQAAAAIAIGVLAQESAEVAEELIQLNVVHGLVVALGTLDPVASQRHASVSLEYFVHMVPFVEECVQKALGHTVFQHFMDSPKTWYTRVDPVQAGELASSLVDIPRDMARTQSTKGKFYPAGSQN